MARRKKTPQAQPLASTKSGNSSTKSKRKKKGGGGSGGIKTTMQMAPVSYGLTMSGSSTTMDKSSPFLVKYRSEYIVDITGVTGGYTLQTTLAINPGLSGSFPWLSRIANNYDMYRFTRLRLCYVAKTTSANTGEVNIVFDPDPTEAPPISDAEALQYDTKISTVPWAAGVYVDVPRSDLNRIPKFLVRDGVVSSDVTTYDVGVVYIICSGNLAAVRIGQLWMEYEIEFYAPQIKGTGAMPPKMNSQFILNSTTAITTAVTTRIPFDTVQFNPLGITINAGSITGLSGSFVVYVQQTVSAATLTSGALLIRKNGAGQISAQYPPLLNGQSTMNAEVIVQLVPSDILDTAVSLNGTTLSVNGAGFNVLVITPA